MPSVSNPYQISTAEVAPNYLDGIAVSYFELLLKSFHVPIKMLACKAEYLEELFYSAMRHRYPDTAIIWNAGSHQKGTDISITENLIPNGRTFNMSVKSGQIGFKKISDGTKKQFLSISGNRLQEALKLEEGATKENSWDAGADSLIDWLNAHHRDLIILTAPSNEDVLSRIYEVRFISPENFVYPTKANWNLQGSTIKCELSSGVRVDIKPKLSWQIWWDIPLDKTTLVKRIEVKL